MAGFRIWVMTEIEYDQYGNATILRSFSKPSKSSEIQKRAKDKKAKVNKVISTGEVALWE